MSLPRPTLAWHSKSVGLVTAVIGLALFAYTVRQAGLTDILQGLWRVGAGFVLIVLLSGVRETARTLAWIGSIAPPHRLPFGPAFVARITGEALGNVTPFGLLLSEPSKAVLVRSHVPPLVAFAALASEQILYSLSVTIVISCGLLAFLLTSPLPEGLRLVTAGSLGGIMLLGLAGLWLIRAEPKIVTGLLRYLSRLGLAGPYLESRLDHVRATEERVFAFYARNARQVLLISLLEVVFHVAGVAEVYVTLALVSPMVAPTLLTAFIFETVNRIINVVFKFVPLRLGVDEVGTGLIAQVLGLGTAAGVTVAIVRKARVLWWTALGMAFLIGRGFSVRSILEQVRVGDDPLAPESPSEEAGEHASRRG